MNSLTNFLDKWMPEGERSIEFGKDFVDVVQEISRNAFLIGIHKADQDNAARRDCGSNWSSAGWFAFGCFSCWVLLRMA
jgi:hypothetical protein